MSYEGKSGGGSGGGGGAEGKSGEGGHGGGGGRKGKKQKARSLIGRLNEKLLRGRGRHCFEEWFTPAEVDVFRDNADLTQMDPLYYRYMEKMEAAMSDFSQEEGLASAMEIFQALEACRDETNEYKQLDKMIDTMSKKEEFFIMMQKRAERQHAKRVKAGDPLPSGSPQQFSGK